jgi:hypothetical protein
MGNKLTINTLNYVANRMRGQEARSLRQFVADELRSLADKLRDLEKELQKPPGDPDEPARWLVATGYRWCSCCRRWTLHRVVVDQCEADEWRRRDEDRQRNAAVNYGDFRVGTTYCVVCRGVNSEHYPSEAIEPAQVLAAKARGQGPAPGRTA